MISQSKPVPILGSVSFQKTAQTRGTMDQIYSSNFKL